MPKDTDQAYMQQALALAQKAADQDEVPVGAVIVYQDHIIAQAHNQPIGTHDPTAHAEIIALRQAAEHLNNYRLLNTTLYVTLEPCAMCLGAIMHARVARLVYGATDPKTGVLDGAVNLLETAPWNHALSVTGGVLAPASAALLQAFFQARR